MINIKNWYVIITASGIEENGSNSDVLEERVEELESVEKDYSRIRKLFGVDRIDGLLREMKEQERVEAEMEKERRKTMRKKNEMKR